jgi:pyrroloquinoline quinone (PQQ) biosynthesis protein C
LESAGVDTTQLNEYITQLQALIDSNTSDFTQYMSDLGTANDTNCGDSPQEFYSALQQARAARELILGDVKEVVSFIKDNIKAELLNIRQQLADEASATETNDGGTE